MAPKLTKKEAGKVVPDYIVDNCAKYPTKIFLTQPMGGDAVKDWTFAQFLSESKKMAAHIESLRARSPS
jgi:long-chain acyl-CoA synthetase